MSSTSQPSISEEEPQAEGDRREYLIEPSSRLLLEDDNKNPFLNDSVLMKLFDICDKSDLRKFRLVSKQWHLISRARFQEEMTLNICQPTNGNYYCRRQKWETFRKDYEPGSNQFKSYRLMDFQFCSSAIQFDGTEYSIDVASLEEVYRNMRRFFSDFGPWIYKLELVKSTIYSEDAFKKAIFEETPNLRELKLDQLATPSRRGYSTGDERDVDVVKIQPNLKILHLIKPWTYNAYRLPWRLVFLHFPNIKALEIEFNQSSSGDELEFESLCGALKDLSEATEGTQVIIEELKISKRWQMLMERRRTYFVPMMSMEPLFALPQFKLSTLHFDISCEDEHLANFPTAMHLHGKTLKTLWLTDESRSSRFHLNPEMEAYKNFPFLQDPFELASMEELQLHVPVCLHFLERFPNLKILRLEPHYQDGFLEKTDLARMSQLKKLHHVTEFKFNVRYCSYFFMSRNVMRMFVKLMPNVEFFSGQLTAASFRVVCKNWRQLRKLEILHVDEEFDDEAVSGHVTSHSVRLANVTDLTNLRHLSISGGNLSDISVWNECLELAPLKTLNLSPSKNKLGYQAVDALRKRFPYTKINIQQSVGPEPRPYFDEDIDYEIYNIDDGCD